MTGGGNRVGPYQTSSSESPARPGSPTEPRHRWLVLVSLLTAVFLEVLPLEAGMLLAAAVHGGALLLLFVKLLCLAAILGPVLVYLQINGRSGLSAVSRRLAIIGAIVGLNLALNALVVAGILRS